MKLTRKETTPLPQKKDNTLSAAQKEMYTIDMTMCAPVGKYQGKNLHWIKANDSSYWSWMEKESIVWSWNCVKLKDSALRPKTDKPKWQVFINHTGEQWCTLRIIEEKTQPCPVDWYE